MIDCKQCPDKLQGMTGNIKECRRGFKLKHCCREYLINRRKHLLRTILMMPEEMIKDGKLEINEICRSCGKEIKIFLSIGDEFKIKQSEPIVINRYSDSTTSDPVWIWQATTTRSTSNEILKAKYCEL